MITVIYCGGDEYKIHFDTMSLVLSKTQMEDIAEYAIENHFNTPLVNKLEEKVSDYEFELDVLRNKISDHIGNIEELIDDEETEPIHLIRELEAIKKVIEESE